jgi:hypothetical protein
LENEVFFVEVELIGEILIGKVFNGFAVAVVVVAVVVVAVEKTIHHEQKSVSKKEKKTAFQNDPLSSKEFNSFKLCTRGQCYKNTAVIYHG